MKKEKNPEKLKKKESRNFLKLKKNWCDLLIKNDLCLNYSITLNLWNNLEKSELEKSIGILKKSKINLEKAKIFEKCEIIETETEMSDFESFDINSEEFLTFSINRNNDVIFEYEKIKDLILDDMKKNLEQKNFNYDQNNFSFEKKKFDEKIDDILKESQDFVNENILVFSIVKKKEDKKIQKKKYYFLDYDDFEKSKKTTNSNICYFRNKIQKQNKYLKKKRIKVYVLKNKNSLKKNSLFSKKKIKTSNFIKKKNKKIDIKFLKKNKNSYLTNFKIKKFYKKNLKNN